MPTEIVNITDDLLLDRLIKGDRQAFEILYNRYWLSCCNAAYKRLNDKEIAQDIVQNIFVRLWINRETLDIKNFDTYLKAAVRYGVLDYVSRTKTSINFTDTFETILLEKEMPNDRLAAKELLELVYAYSETLPKKRREIFLMHLKDTFSTREIAESLNVSQKTVQNQIRTALNGLQTRISALFL